MFSGLQSCRVEPSLATSDAQRNYQPEKYNGSFKRRSKERKRITKSGCRGIEVQGYRGIGSLSPLGASQNAHHFAQHGVNGSHDGVNGSLNRSLIMWTGLK
eukprot:4733222-Heterocapsa_arctica.AAC.1